MFKKILLSTTAAFTLFFPLVAFAGPLDSAKEKLNDAIAPTKLQSEIEVSVGTVVRTILSLVGTLFLILTIYAGILWMTAQGSGEQIEKAQNIISAAIIGLFITMAAYAITTFVTGKLGGVGTGPSPSVPNQQQGGQKSCIGSNGTCIANFADCAAINPKYIVTQTGDCVAPKGFCCSAN